MSCCLANRIMKLKDVIINYHTRAKKIQVIFASFLRNFPEKGRMPRNLCPLACIMKKFCKQVIGSFGYFVILVYGTEMSKA